MKVPRLRPFNQRPRRLRSCNPRCRRIGRLRFPPELSPRPELPFPLLRRSNPRLPRCRSRSPPVPASNSDAPVRVGLTADEPVWILVRSDGKYFFSGTLGANESRTFEAASTVLVRLGNAGGVTMTLNGNPVGPVAPRGRCGRFSLPRAGSRSWPCPSLPRPSIPCDGASPLSAACAPELAIRAFADS